MLVLTLHHCSFVYLFASEVNHRSKSASKSKTKPCSECNDK